MGVLTDVRSQTKSVHQSLDDHPLLVQFMSQNNVSAYRGFLKTFHLFLTHIESQSADSIPESDREILQYSAWIDALEADLSALGDETAEPYAGLLPKFDGTGQYWGLLYVMEGSVLGGVKVATMIPPEWPSESLKRGAQNRLRWPYFCRRLGEMETFGAILSTDVQMGAIKAFASMIKIFDAYLVAGPSPYSHRRSVTSTGALAVPGDMG